jgi:hypothetical protein
MPFTTPLVVRRVDACNWELVAPLSYQGRVDHWTVPSGTVTDFASVPRWLQSFVQATGTWTLAAVLHDWLITVGIPTGQVTSRQTDGVFRRVLREERVGAVRRWCMWTAVRLAAPRNPKRRPSQIGRDLPAVTGISLAVLIAFAAVVVVLHLAVGALLNLI